MAEAGELRRELVAAFKHIDEAHGGTPAWAWPCRPPIPLVGDDYVTGKGLLVYASAENLSCLNDEDDAPRRFTSEKAWDRYDKGDSPVAACFFLKPPVPGSLRSLKGRTVVAEA